MEPRVRLVVMAGNVEPALVPVYMNAADCLLVTSDFEGSPTVVQEAMACRLPVISVDVGDVRDVLRGVTPGGVYGRDIDQLAAAVVGVLATGRRSDGDSRMSEFSTDSVARRTVDVYRSAISSSETRWRRTNGMRILYLHQYFTTPEFPGGIRSYEMARRLVEYGHSVRLLTSSAFLGPDWAPSPGWHQRSIAGVDVDVYREPYSNRLRYRDRIRAFGRFAVASTLRGRRYPVDVVFASSTPLTIAIPGVLCARRSGVPFVFEVRDLWPDVPIALGALRGSVARTLATGLANWAYRNATRIVALSPGMAAAVLATGRDASEVTVIPNAADPEVFRCTEDQITEFRAGQAWLGSRPLVVYTGTFGKVNGLSYLVRLAAASRDLAPELRFLAIGDGAEREQIIAEARQAGVLEVNLFIWPPRPKRDLAPIVAAADLTTSFVLPIPALWENSANKFFDGLAAGTPVGINHGGWQAEILERAGAGLVLDPHDVARAAADLVAFVTDPRGCRAPASRRGGWRPRISIATCWRDVLKLALQRRSRRRPQAGGSGAGLPTRSTNDAISSALSRVTRGPVGRLIRRAAAHSARGHIPARYAERRGVTRVRMQGGIEPVTDLVATVLRQPQHLSAILHEQREPQMDAAGPRVLGR